MSNIKNNKDISSTIKSGILKRVATIFVLSIIITSMEVMSISKTNAQCPPDENGYQWYYVDEIVHLGGGCYILYKYCWTINNTGTLQLHIIELAELYEDQNCSFLGDLNDEFSDYAKRLADHLIMEKRPWKTTPTQYQFGLPHLPGNLDGIPPCGTTNENDYSGVVLIGKPSCVTDKYQQRVKFDCDGTAVSFPIERWGNEYEISSEKYENNFQGGICYKIINVISPCNVPSNYIFPSDYCVITRKYCINEKGHILPNDDDITAVTLTPAVCEMDQIKPEIMVYDPATNENVPTIVNCHYNCTTMGE